MSGFQKTPASHWRVNTYSALSFDPIYLKMSVNPEDWDVDFAFPDLIQLCLNKDEADVETES